MPAVRGSSFGYETTTSNAGVTIPVCPNEANDLLIAVCMADTGVVNTFTATPPSGWSILQEWYNTTPMIAYMKIASGSDGDLDILATTHATVNETYNGSMTSFRDVDLSRPVSTAWLANYDSYDSSLALYSGSTVGIAQSFTTPAATANTNARGCFSHVAFQLKKVGSPTGNVVAKIYAHSGTYGASSVPTGAALATSNAIDASALGTSYTWWDFTFPASSWYQFAANTQYVVALEYSGGDGSNYVHVGYQASGAHGGNKATYNGSVWSAQATEDTAFYANRFTFNMSNMSAAGRTNMPQITTIRDDSLVVYLGGGGGSAGTPSFVEGPVSQIHASDGAAESHGMGWAFQKTAGNTPNNIYCSMTATGASVKGVLAVNPPTSGATVIPPYVASDSCTLVDFVAGTAGFNGNTGLAATADTGFGTSVGGYTANDATVAAVTDVGINSFHSMGGMTNAATAGQVSGAQLVLASGNRFDFSSKNLLGHVRLTSPSHGQRFPAADAGRGFWAGVRSDTGSGGATTGWKVWQTYGVEVPWPLGSVVPFVINSGAGNTKGTSGTLDASVIAAVGFWTSGIATLTAQACVGPLWLMDTTTIVGGNSSEPLDIAGIVAATAKGKERLSAIQQGAKQMLCLQDIVIGDGATNPLYLDLDGVAIEFPRQYNLLSRQINYNSVDNKVGITLYPGSGQTCNLKNSILYSQSRYKFGLHASASTGATYDLSGTSIIGAGTISLARGITLTGLTINDYSTLDISGLTLTQSAIKGVPTANDSLTTNGSTTVSNCTLNVSGVTSGNRWCSVASPVIFTNCAFTGGGGHAIRITSPGTYSLVGNTFTGFGANGSNGAAIYNDSGGVVTLNCYGGTLPTVRNGSGASTNVNAIYTLSITNLVQGTQVTIVKSSDQTELQNSTAPAGGTVTYTHSGGETVDILIMHLSYDPNASSVYGLVLPSADSSIKAQQSSDLNYENP